MLCFQDGASFYNSETGELIETVPIRVRDGDADLAGWARSMFRARMKRRGVVVRFEEESM